MKKDPNAELLVWEAIASQQSGVPLWVLLNADWSVQREDQQLRVCIWLYDKHDWGENYIKERKSDGRVRIIKIDPATDQRRPVFTYDVRDEERIRLFEAEVDLVAHTVTFISYTVLDTLLPGDYELRYEDPVSLPNHMTNMWEHIVRKANNV